MESHRRTSPNAAAHAQLPRPAPRRSPPRIEKLLDDFRSPPIRRRVRKTDEDESFKSLFWHGGPVYDAWFSCASNQVAQVLLTLPYSFSQLGLLSGIILQVFYGILGSWTAYLISVLYVEYRTRKEKENVSFKNHVIQVTFSYIN
ncbi:hypothetical protein ACS0TY_004147 [Phlomoides rotata]